MKNKKKMFIIIIICALILGVGIFLLISKSNKVIPEDQYEKVIEVSKNYIHYNFELSDSDKNTYEYKIKNYDLKFNILDDNKGNYEINGEKVETVAKIYDVYYLKKNKSVIILDITEFGMGFHLIDENGMHNIADYLSGSFSIEDLELKNNKLLFNVLKYSDNYLIVAEDAIFNLCLDNYQDYTKDDYVVKESYEIDLNKEFKKENFKVTSKMTIKELYEQDKDKCKNIKDIQIASETEENKEGE